MLTPEQARRLAKQFGSGLDGRADPAHRPVQRSSPAPRVPVAVVQVRRTEDGPLLCTEPAPDASPIHAHAERCALDDRARIALVAEACALVAAAHAQGVQHRDLRPSNVLVDHDDAVVVVRFGADEATGTEDRSDAVETTVTHLAEAMRYLSPEQCAGPGDAVDGRSDVYALGVILYELLCRKPPLDLREATLSRAMEIVRTTPPEPPSRHRPELAGPIERTILRAIEKSRELRHDSVAALGAELRAILAADGR